MPYASSSHGHRSYHSQVSPTNTMGLGPLLNYFYSQQTSGTSVNHAAVNSMPTVRNQIDADLGFPKLMRSQELPFIVLQALVHNFLHNASCFGFFLDTQAFHDAVTSSNGRNLPPVLMNVLYLWGVHLSKDERITMYEPAFLAHALRSTASSLSGTHPRTILHSLQASVLLAYYFIRNARFLEGKYHTSAAVSIALSAGLHRIRGSHSSAYTTSTEALPPAADAVEEGERINAFWTVLTLNNCWASTDGSPSNVSYGSSGLKIDTPWPLDPRDYVERPHLVPRHSSGTVTRFMTDGPDDVGSCAALYAKAGILFESATRLGARYRTNGIPPNDPHLSVMVRRIDVFAAGLPAIQSKAMLVIHTLVHVATIQLHNLLVKDHPFARTKALSAARSVVDCLAKTDVPNVGLIDPIIAPLWTSTGLVIINEVVRRRLESGSIHKGLVDALNIVVTAMQIFAQQSRLAAAQLETVRQAYNSARIGS